MIKKYKGIYPLLNKKLEEKDVKRPQLSEELGITQKSLFNKLNGKTEFVLSEALKIKEIVAPGESLEELFKRNEN